MLDNSDFYNGMEEELPELEQPRSAKRLNLAGSEAANIFVFPTGVRAKLSKLPMMLLKGLYKKFPEPVVPMIPIPQPGGGKMLQPDYKNKHYVNAVQNWKVQIGLGVLDIGVGMSVDVEFTEEAYAVLAAYRERAAGFGQEIEANDSYSYITYIIAEQYPEVLSELLVRLRNMSAVSEESIAAAIGDFRGNVPG